MSVFKSRLETQLCSLLLIPVPQEPLKLRYYVALYKINVLLICYYYYYRYSWLVGWLMMQRLPVERPQSDNSPFLGFIYFSLVAPLSGRGYPPGSTTFLEMSMRHSGQYIKIKLWNLLLEPLMLGQSDLLAVHWLSLSKHARIQRIAMVTPVLVQSYFESIQWWSRHHLTW